MQPENTQLQTPIPMAGFAKNVWKKEMNVFKIPLLLLKMNHLYMKIMKTEKMAH